MRRKRKLGGGEWFYSYQGKTAPGSARRHRGKKKEGGGKGESPKGEIGPITSRSYRACRPGIGKKQLSSLSEEGSERETFCWGKKKKVCDRWPRKGNAADAGQIPRGGGKGSITARKKMPTIKRGLAASSRWRVSEG